MKKHNLVKERNKKAGKAEVYYIRLSVVLFVVGVIAEAFNSCFCLIEIESDFFNGICTTLVGVQATISVVIFSLLTMFSSFQNKERYGISVVKYLTKYRNIVLTQTNIFYMVFSLLGVSVTCLFFEWINLIFCSLIASTLLVTYLAKESFLIYKLEDIDEDMFSFLENNLHNEDLNLLEEYYRSERKHLDDGDYKRKKPESKLDKIWVNEIDKYSSSLDSEEFRRSHDVFTAIVTEYLNSSDMSVQSYGIDIALTIIERYSKEKKRESKVDQYGRVVDDFPVKYAKDAFRIWMLSFTHIVYSENSDRVKVKNIVSLINKLETTISKYDRYTLTNNFLFLLIRVVDVRKGNLDELSNILNILRFHLCSSFDSEVRKNQIGFAVHFFLMAIECGYIQIVGKEFKRAGLEWVPETEEERLLFGIVVCYFYYMAYAAKEDEIDKLYEERIKKRDFIKVLQENNDVIFSFFYSLELSPDYLSEMKKYMKSYEIFILDNGSKTMIIDEVIDEGMVLFKALATNPFMDEWLKKIVNDDWFHIYNMFVVNKNTKNNLLEIKWFGNYTEESIDKIYINLVDTIVELSYDAVLNSSKTIKKESEDELTNYTKFNIRQMEEELSFGSVSKEIESNTCLLLRHLELKESIYWNDYMKNIKGFILKEVCKLLSDTFKSKVITSHSEAENFLDAINGDDYLAGNSNIPLYDKDFELRRKVYESVSEDYYAPFFKNGLPAIIAANKDKIGVMINVTDVKVRKLTDEEKRGKGNKVSGKYKEQIVNDIYFYFDEEDYFRFIDNEYRILDIRFFVGVSANENDGICYIFQRQGRK